MHNVLHIVYVFYIHIVYVYVIYLINQKLNGLYQRRLPTPFPLQLLVPLNFCKITNTVEQFIFGMFVWPNRGVFGVSEGIFPLPKSGDFGELSKFVNIDLHWPHFKVFTIENNVLRGLQPLQWESGWFVPVQVTSYIEYKLSYNKTSVFISLSNC